MELNLKSVLEINGVVRNYIDRCSNMSVKFRLLSLVKKLEIEIENFETVKDELFEKYGTQNENGSFSIDRKSENFKPFTDAYKDLLRTKVNINIDKISIEDLRDMTADELVVVYDLITE